MWAMEVLSYFSNTLEKAIRRASQGYETCYARRWNVLHEAMERASQSDEAWLVGRGCCGCLSGVLAQSGAAKRGNEIIFGLSLSSFHFLL